MIEDQILNEIEQNQDEYIAFLQELIQAESYNPPGNEKNVALIIEKYLKNVNIKSEIFPFGDNRANLFTYLNEDFEKKNLLYNVHMDVVPPGVEEEWKYPPLSATIKRKKFLYGRGAADMKSALAAVIVSLKILHKLDLKLEGNLLVNAVADEETGGNLGTGWCLENILKKRSIKCDFIIICEPSRIKPLPKAIIFGEKGHLIIKVITNGKSAHSMTPSMGKNAIYMMSKIIENLDKLEKYMAKVDPPFTFEELITLLSKVFPNREIVNRILDEQPLLRDMVLSLTEFTLSLNVIKGGIKANVIPDRCEALIDFRLLPGQNSEMILNSLKKLINELGYEVKEKPSEKPAEEIFVYLEIESDGPSSLWEDYHKAKDVKTLKKIVENVYGKKPFYWIAMGATDAHFYRNSKYCENTIHFGPGEATQMHATDEHIEIQDFINAIKVYTLFAYNYLKK